MAGFRTTAYRNPGEYWAFALVVVGLVAASLFTAPLTGCLSVVFVVLFMVGAWVLAKDSHERLMKKAHPVTAETEPVLYALVQATAQRLGLRADEVRVYVAGGGVNALTYGLTRPRVIVLQAGLLRVMNRAQLAYVLAHEFGHVQLGHAWWNSLAAGMVSMPLGWLAYFMRLLLFQSWQRACEFSADRAGLLAVGDIRVAEQVMMTMLALTSKVRSEDELQALLLQAERGETGDFEDWWGELWSTHPLMQRRIVRLREYAASAEFRALLVRLEVNGPVVG